MCRTMKKYLLFRRKKMEQLQIISYYVYCSMPTSQVQAGEDMTFPCKKKYRFMAYVFY